MIRTIAKSAIGSLVAIVCGIITTKLIAFTLGTTGVGLFSLTRQAYLTMLGLTSLQSINVITQGVSSKRGDEKEKYKATLFTLLSCNSILVSMVMLALLPLFPNYSFLLSMLPIPLFLGTLTVFNNGLLTSAKQVHKVTIGQAFGASVAALLTYPAIHWLPAEYAVLTIIFSMSFASFAFSLSQVHRSEEFRVKRLLKFEMSRSLAKEFLSYASVTCISGLMSLGTVLLLRTIVMWKEGLQGAGLFDASWTLSSTYLMVLLTALSGIILPSIAENMNTERVCATLDKALLIVTILATPLIVTLIFFKPLVVTILYSSEFLRTLELMRWLLVGDFLKSNCWILGLTMLARADKTSFFLTECILNFLLLAGGYVSVVWLKDMSHLGIVYVVIYLIYLLFCLKYTFRHFGYRLNKPVKWLWGSSAAVILIGSAINWEVFTLETWSIYTWFAFFASGSLLFFKKFGFRLTFTTLKENNFSSHVGK